MLEGEDIADEGRYKKKTLVMEESTYSTETKTKYKYCTVLYPGFLYCTCRAFAGLREKSRDYGTVSGPHKQSNHINLPLLAHHGPFTATASLLGRDLFLLLHLLVILLLHFRLLFTS
jgi:hypothetical protein